MKFGWPVLLLGLCFANVLLADGPKDNIPDQVRSVPPPGKKIPEADRKELTAGTQELGDEIAQLHNLARKKPGLLELLPDVEIFYNAVHYALTYDEFFKDPDKTGKYPEVLAARKLLQIGFERAKALHEGKAPWTTATGLVVRGYRSRIDGSVQPYGLVVPTTYLPGTAYPHRLDIWFHGRNENLSELNFLDDRLKSPGQFTPAHAFVLHPYGRYCCANHFAGEVDTFEAIEHVQKHYPIDNNRIIVRGFSMGGAACWHFAVHHAGLWAAAAPGAGFSETPDFLKIFQDEKLQPTWYEKKLWHLYDCPDYAINLFQCPTVAYSGEKDKQKQAADVMARALKEEGIELVHVIGPDTQHSYHPQAVREINKRIDSIAAKGRDPLPHRIRFTTWTLRYNRMSWVHVEGLEKHWERARVNADIIDQGMVKVHTENVTALTITMPSGFCPLSELTPPVVVLDEQKIEANPVRSDRSWTSHFRKNGKTWELVKTLDDDQLRKRPGLQGPIDDAFMDRFLMVRPTGKSPHAQVEIWVAGEMAHALDHWRKQFRGIAPVKDDVQVTEEDIASSNLILWGDPASNRVLAKINAKLPIAWEKKEIKVGTTIYDSNNHVPVLICPNPLNPKKYVVLNSGFTFREYDYLNNARQVPKLPDWAILDVRQPPTSRNPARIVEASFFDENWK